MPNARNATVRDVRSHRMSHTEFGSESVLPASGRRTRRHTHKARLEPTIPRPRPVGVLPLNHARSGIGSQSTRPLRTAHTAAWVRSLTAIFRKMFCTCSLTVSTLISSERPISRLLNPKAT